MSIFSHVVGYKRKQRSFGRFCMPIEKMFCQKPALWAEFLIRVERGEPTADVTSLDGAHNPSVRHN